MLLLWDNYMMATHVKHHHHYHQHQQNRQMMRSHLVLIAFMLLNFTKCNETLSKVQTRKMSPDNNLMQESLIIPTNGDAESAARKLYDEALKQYGDLGRTLKEMCLPWKAKGCQCTGTSVEVVLVCRDTHFTTVPAELPEELIKLWVNNQIYILNIFITLTVKWWWWSSTPGRRNNIVLSRDVIVISKFKCDCNVQGNLKFHLHFFHSLCSFSSIAKIDRELIFVRFLFQVEWSKKRRWVECEKKISDQES